MLRSRAQFKSWYPQYVYQLSIIMREDCQGAYSIYLYGTRHNTTEVTLSGAGRYTLFVEPMINCLLENLSEYIKYQMGSTQIMLGLTPTIIALLGASSEEVCLLALIGRRRLLGLLLATASPSIYTERAFKYQDPDKILKERLRNTPQDKDHVFPSMHTRRRWFIVLLEYLAVLLAVTNIAQLNWDLGVKSVNAFNANTVFMPMLWSLLGVATHLAGAVVFNMRARRLDEENTSKPGITPRSALNAMRFRSLSSAISTLLNSLRRTIMREFCLGTEGPKEKLYFHLIPESRLFTLLAWLLSVCTIFNIILGTLILSSTNFVGPKDALGVMARYILSVIVCRVILLYELAVLRVEYKNANAPISLPP